MKRIPLSSLCLAMFALAFPARAAFPFNTQGDHQTDSHGYYYIVTGGKFPTGNIPNGDNASGGVFRFLLDDPIWGRPLDTWHKDDWFTDNAGFALTLKSAGTIVYDNNGIEDGTYGDYYNGDGSHAEHGLYRGYSMANNYDWIYSSYFKLDQETTFDTIIGYFDANGGAADLVPFNPNSPGIGFRMNIWSAEQDMPLANPNSWMPAVASFSGDVLSTDLVPGCFSVSDTGVLRVWSSYPGFSPDPIWRLEFKLAQPVTLPVGEYFFSHDAVVLCPVTSDLLADPNPAPLNGTVTLTAVVDDSTTGNTDIASAEYSINGGPWIPMAAADGTFDSPTENVTATFSPAPPAIAGAGIYKVFVRGVDANGDVGQAQCLQLVVYDPSAGFVTGGGWIHSPAGAYLGPDAWQVKWDQPFDGNTDGWLDDDDSPGYGFIIPLGDGTANVQGLEDPEDHKFYGPFSRFDGYHDAWPGTWVAEIDVYLDPAWAAGQGFDYSVAANGSDGNHLRDYIFHVTKDTSTGKLLVAGSNNTNFEPREDLETINHYEVGTAGWYTLKHRFHDAGGHLAVDLILLDSAGNVLFTETRSSLGDTIPGAVGGNRYAWFTFVSVAGGIRVDNHQRFEYGPTSPTGKATFGFVSKYQKNASVPTGSTEFVFQAAGLNFHSSSYEWLVVNKSDLRAQFKGAGTVNGVGPYKFMLWAFDGTPSGTPDTFRIKIWEEAPDETKLVVYDNGFDGSGFETGQPIGGGNVLVHVSRK